MYRGLKSGVDLELKVSLKMFFCAVILGKDLLFDMALSETKMENQARCQMLRTQVSLKLSL